MWSDNESEQDLLGFEHLSDAIIQLVRNDDLLPATIGVYGDWGSGKSSLLRMVEGQLNADEKTIVLSFNGWLFEGYEEAKTALMGSILEELLDHQKILPAAKDKVKGLLKRVNGLKLAFGVGKLAVGLGTGLLPVALSGGGDLLSVVGAMAASGTTADPEAFKGILNAKNEKEEEETAVRRRQIREFRKDFAKFLDEAGIDRLIVIIDDLDRCLPDTIIETLEAIKLFLFVKKTAFILGADERLVMYAVRTRFPELPGEQVEVGRDYLEKLIQFPIRIPTLGQSEMESYVGLLFAGLGRKLSDEVRVRTTNSAALLIDDGQGKLKKGTEIISELLGNEIPEELKEQLAIANRVAPVLASGLNGNPRQCKRFLNTLLIRSKMAKFRDVELKQPVLAKLMLLEYFKPESFRKLAELQIGQAGKPVQLKQLEVMDSNVVETVAGKEEAPERGKSKQVASKNVALKTPLADNTTSSQTNSELEGWKKEPWLNHWLEMEPRLSGVDLRPYFFFSRDLLSGLRVAEINRISPQARDVLAKLLNESEAIRISGVEKIKILNMSDVAGIFEGLTQRALGEEIFGGANQPLIQLFSISEVRRELTSELFPFLKRLPESKIEPVIVTKVEQLGKTHQLGEQSDEILLKWSKSDNTLLATGAKMRLKGKEE